MERQLRDRVNEEREILERDYQDQRARMEAQTASERNHDKQIVDQAKRDKRDAEDKAHHESMKAARIEEDAHLLR